MKKFTLLLSLIFLLTSGFLLVEEVKAGTGDNVSGYAWSENIGWISFNSLNCDGDGNGFSDGIPNCPPAGTPIANYGVDVDLITGAFSGYAWSENIGWIWFAPTDTTPDGTVNPATLNLVTNEVSGWARACAGAANPDCTGGANPVAGGWDGWVKLRGLTTEAIPTEYGVSRNTIPDPDEFEGWAWSDNIIGWVSFNCSNQGVCLTSNYKVFIVNQPPSATGLSADVTSGDYCAGSCIGSAPVFLSWTYSDPEGDPQSAYQVQVATDSSFLSIVVDSGKVLSASTTYAPPGLGFDATYFWRLIVWDSADTPSTDWIVYLDNVPPPESFTTGPRPPCTDFDWAPPNPSAGEIIEFTDQTTFYGTGPGWAWDFDADGITDSTDQNPTHSYLVSGDYTVELTATDTGGSCSLQQTLTVRLPLPEWKEIAPVGWLEKLFAALLSLFQV